MANQAFSVNEDLMVGAGEIWFKRSDDANGWHHLGNVEEMNITVENETVEKNSSMNKKRTLMQRVVTSTTASASLTMDEYNPYNLALGLFGTGVIETRGAATYNAVQYVVPSVPGAITLVDADGNRLYGAKITAVEMQGATTTPPTITSTDPGYTVTNGSAGSLSSVVTQGVGAVLTFTGSNTSTSVEVPLNILVDGSSTTAGDFQSATATVSSTDPNYSATVTNVATVAGVGVDGALITVSVTKTSAGVIVERQTISIEVMPQNSTDTLDTFTYTVNSGSISPVLVEDTDYQASEQDLQAGIIRIMDSGKISKGDVLLVSCTVDGKEFVNISGADAGDIKGEFLYTSSNNTGPNYVIEGWNVRVEPDGDLSGLISDDFGSFSLTVTFLDDSKAHPKYPLFKVTTIGRTSADEGKQGEYSPEW